MEGNGIAGYADGNGINAQFNHPIGIAIDKRVNIYVADLLNHRIRKINFNQMAGFADGPAASGEFNHPCGIVIDAGGSIYVADNLNNRIRKIVLQ